MRLPQIPHGGTIDGVNVPAKLGAYGVVLALSLLGGAAAGAAAGPIDIGDPPAKATGQDGAPASTHASDHRP